jgi:hypothetical protein
MTTSTTTSEPTPFADPTRKDTTDVETLMIAAHSETAISAERDLRTALAAGQAQAEQLRRDVADAERRHRDDIAVIGERLIQEANDRDWCQTYDDIVDELNEKLTFELPLRERDFTVTALVELRLAVTATSEEHARDLAEDHVEQAEKQLDAMDSITSYPQERYRWEVEQDD